MRKLAFACLWLIVFTFPWEGLVIFEGVGTLSRVLGYAALVFGLLALARSKIRPMGTPHLLIALYLAWCTCSLFWSVDPEETVTKILVYFRVVGFAWLIWEFARTRSQQVKLFYAYLCGCTVSIATVFWAAWTGVRLVEGSAEVRYTGGGMNANELAAILALSVVVAVYLMSASRLRVSLALLAYCGAASLATLMTGSRGGLIVLGLGVGLMVITNFSISMRTRLAFSILLVGALVLAQDILPRTLRARLEGTGEELRYGSWSERKDIYGYGLEIVKDSPVRGIGCGAFAGAMEQRFGWGIDAHSTYLMVLAGTGTIGFLLFFSFPILLFKRIWRLPWRERFLWYTLLMMWVGTAISTTWDSSKITWFVFSLALSWISKEDTSQTQRRPWGDWQSLLYRRAPRISSTRAV